MQISVQGDQRVRVAPERAELFLNVTEEGTDRSKVIAAVTAAANRVAGELAEATTAGTVESHVVEPLRIHAWRKNRTSAERVTATVGVRATFVDFEALGRSTADLAGRPGVQLGWVRWFLTDATADRLRDECIAGAVDRARSRAEAMARAAGAGEIEIVEIADPGLLGTADAQTMFGGREKLFAARAMGMSAEAAPEPVEIRPEDIEVAAQLQLRFVTR